MHEVTKTAAFTGAFVVLATLCFSEISDRREFCGDHFTSVISAVHAFHRAFSLVLILELYVDIANHVIADVVSNDHFI